jgi:hypothetical protein
MPHGSQKRNIENSNINWHHCHTATTHKQQGSVMGYLSAVITIIREWITRVISQGAPESVGRVVVTAGESSPLPPTNPPHLCAYEAQQVELIGAQLESILAQYTAAVEAFTACMESTQMTASDFKTERNNVDLAFKYMKQNLKACRAILKKMRSEK